VVDILTERVTGGFGEQLPEALKECPGDLGQLYDAILKKVPDWYVHWTISYLELLKASNDISLEEFSIAAEDIPEKFETRSERYIKTAAGKQMKKIEWLARLSEGMPRRIRS
jgi:hypothetical protein